MNITATEWSVLVDYRRAGVIENTIFGALAWVHGDAVVHALGEDVLIYGRSCLKPFMVQSLAAPLESILVGEQRALSVSSHNGWEEHVEVARSILAPEDHELLQTPADLPLVAGGFPVRAPNKWRNNGSGLHAAVLRGCAALGWPIEDYRSEEHPFFRATLKRLRRWLGAEWDPKHVATDGDGFPTVTLTLSELARCYAGWVSERDADWIWESMNLYPNMVGGAGRLDSALLVAGGGQLVAKEGADGLLALGVAHPAYPRGLGIAVKIAHGWDPRAMGFVAQRIVAQLGFSVSFPDSLRGQEAFVASGVVTGA